jgi:hypothetical protein
MAHSNVYMTISEVTNCEVNRSFELTSWKADADVFAKLGISRNQGRTITVHSGAGNLLALVVPNAPGTLVCVLNDLINGTGSGAMTYTLTNAIIGSNPFADQHNTPGGGSLTFVGYAADGLTDPLTIATAT